MDCLTADVETGDTETVEGAHVSAIAEMYLRCRYAVHGVLPGAYSMKLNFMHVQEDVASFDPFASN
ncbi:hypothetical protein [Glacieibacterium frigidum]|uniref:Uncharacterized protein n=1 Tax=Glacieibacterium frigidum TaxID=2593303 RepID=A0A552U7E4_9SPHN|nr:hypothetical protein [Glacieibacterium frigidum]TRW14137.1 hypothetical protein FMM06_10440 [Glacieibacterium frigidum]